MSTVNWIVAGFSFICASFATSVAIYFWRFRRHPLGRSFFIDMVCESVMAIVAFLFAFETIFTPWDLTHMERTIFRIFILGAIFVSSVHLTYQVRRIVLKDKAEGNCDCVKGDNKCSQ